MSYTVEREMFKEAIAKGWKGKEPSVLGTFYADIAVAEALAFIRSEWARNNPINDVDWRNGE